MRCRSLLIQICDAEDVQILKGVIAYQKMKTILILTFIYSKMRSILDKFFMA